MSHTRRPLGDETEYLGKRLLVGVSYEDQNGALIRQEQFHGVIVKAAGGEVILERHDTGRRFSLPPELQKAGPGEYRLRATGECVLNPDYLATWLIKTPPTDETK